LNAPGEMGNIDCTMQEAVSNYDVKLPVFEGPLDLLLHLIKKNEINICDIPISLITQQYLEYLDLIKSLNLTVAGEFLVMAATLIHIKSKTLLPPAESDDGEEEEDPREELIRRLMEYQRFKDAAQQLEQRELEWRNVFYRSHTVLDDEQKEIDLSDLNLFDLLDAFKSVLENIPEQRSMEIVVQELSVQERMTVILDSLEGQESISFYSLFEQDKTRISVIVTFLALLELIRLKLVRIVQAELFGAIRLWKKAN
jgi:segregation and condensation protein A